MPINLSCEDLTKPVLFFYFILNSLRSKNNIDGEDEINKKYAKGDKKFTEEYLMELFDYLICEFFDYVGQNL